jgi:hypothetical protein
MMEKMKIIIIESTILKKKTSVKREKRTVGERFETRLIVATMVFANRNVREFVKKLILFPVFFFVIIIICAISTNRSWIL